MNLIRTASQNVIRLAKREIHDNAVLVASDDMFEVKKTPSVILQGPTLTENRLRRTLAPVIETDEPNMTFEECQAPWLYHLDFDIVVTCDTQGELLDMQERIARLYQTHPVIELGEDGTLNLTELVPVGGLRRVNLSNLRQASGRLRIEDCPVYAGETTTGKLIGNIQISLSSEGA